MQGRSGRWRTQFAALGLAGVIATAGLAVTQGAAEAALGTVSGATLEWALNNEVQQAAPLGPGSCIYLSAGESDGTAGTYAATAGNVAIVKDGGTPTFAGRCSKTSGSVNQKVVLSNGTGTLDTTTGATTIQWTGTLSANFYNGLVPFWFVNPTLTVAADGSGQLTADMDGYAVDMTTFAKTPLATVEDVVVADLSDVDSANSTGFSVTPDYANVVYNAPPENTPQSTSNPGWGSWPTTFVDFQNQTGLSSHWYSSGGSNDVRKPATAITIGYGTFTGPAVSASPNSNLDPTVSNPITVNGTGFQSVQSPAFQGLYVGLVADSTWQPGQTPAGPGDFIGAVFVPKTTIIGGAFSTVVTVPADAVTDPNADYSIGTICAHGCSVTNRNLDAATPVTFRHAPNAPTAVSATRGAGSASVAFTGPGDDGGAVTQYDASCASSDGGVTQTADGPSSPIVVTGLTKGKTYQCTVTATNNVGTGPASAPSSSFVVPVEPGVPSAVVARSAPSGSVGYLTVSYQGPASNGGTPITGYTATCVSSNGGVSRTHTKHSGAITIGYVTIGKSYTCKVAAKNAAGTGASSASSAAVIVGTPAAPTAVKAARVGAGRLKVTYRVGAANGSAITQKTATCRSSNGGVTKSATHKGPKAAPITVAGLTAGKSYRCTVTAKNARGVGLASAASGAVIG